VDVQILEGWTFKQ